MTMHVHWSNNIYELMLEKNVIVYKLPVVCYAVLTSFMHFVWSLQLNGWIIDTRCTHDYKKELVRLNCANTVSGRVLGQTAFYQCYKINVK